MANRPESVLEFLKMMGVQIKEKMQYHFTNTYYFGKSKKELYYY